MAKIGSGTVPAPPRKTRLAASAVDLEIVLRVNELLQEAVLEDVGLIDVECAPEFDGVVADVADFQRRLWGDLALDAERPLLNVGSAQVRVEGNQAAAALRLREVGGVAEGGVKVGV